MREKTRPIVPTMGKTYLAHMLAIKKFPSWWLLLATGLIFIGIGVLAFLDSLNGYMKLVIFTGIALLLNGGILLTIVIVNTKYQKEKKWIQTEIVIFHSFGVLFHLNPLLLFIELAYFY